jgi:hypothetical protein
MIITRRRLLQTTALTAPALALAACSAGSVTSTSTVAQQVIADVSTLALGVASLLPALGTLKGIPADAIAKAGTAINTITAAATQISGTITQAQALPIIQNIGANVNTLISVLTPFLGLLPPPYGTVIMAAQVLLPVIEAAVGLAVPPAAGGMSVDHARMVLRSVSK